MKSKYLDEGNVRLGYGDKGLTFGDNQGIFSIQKKGNIVIFTEECDGHFDIDMTKSEAVETLEEAIKWIQGD